MSGLASPVPDLLPTAEWHTNASCNGRWTLGAAIGRGESNPCHATRECGLKGVAKPAIQVGGGTPRAAHEKIAADLACHLSLHVPPVLLWTDRISGSKYSISSWACRQPEIWQNSKSILSPMFVRNCSQIIADITVFHSWIADSDRNAGNTLIDLESTESRPQLYFIDHAFGFSHNPRFDGHDPLKAAHGYYPGHHILTTQFGATVSRIETIPPELINQVVGRIPEDFLSRDRGAMIARELVRRRVLLRRALGV